jgi:hypothetical protein
MSNLPVQAFRGAGKTSEQPFVIDAKDWNRMVSGLVQNLPIQTTFEEVQNICPFRVSVKWKTYPKSHPKYENIEACGLEKPDDWKRPDDKSDTRGHFGKGEYCAELEPGVCFCQDTPNVGPTFVTEAWLLGDQAIARIKWEIKQQDFSSCVGNKTEPKRDDPKCTNKYRTFLWEGSCFPLKFEKYEDSPQVVGTSIKIKKAPVPAVFEALGCKSSGGAPEDRTLYHSDIVLSINRPKMKSAFEFMPDGEITGQSILSVSQVYDVPPNCGESSVSSVSSYVPPIAGGASGGGLLGLLMEAENDLGIDQFVIARVYIVSAPNSYNLPEYAEFAFSSVFTKQYIFGNVCYGWRNTPKPEIAPAEPPSPVLGVLGVLAGGIGYQIAASILSFNATASELVMAILKQKKVEGSLWYV